ncbi:hypothetical protein V8F33_000362 [Rhypophila sp. PSN 637]
MPAEWTGLWGSFFFFALFQLALLFLPFIVQYFVGCRSKNKVLDSTMEAEGNRAVLPFSYTAFEAIGHHLRLSWRQVS